MLRRARDAGVRVPEPIAYLGDLDGREAFVMERVHGRDDRPAHREGAAAGARRADGGGAREDPLDPARAPSVPARAPTSGSGCTRSWTRSTSRTRRSSSGSPGAASASRSSARGSSATATSGSATSMVDEHGLVAVLDWEFAHVADPAEDLAWPLVRAWRFGARRPAARRRRRRRAVPRALRRADRHARCRSRSCYAWEVLGNCKWAIGSLTQARRHLRGEERSVELAVLGTTRRRDGVRAPRPDRARRVSAAPTGPPRGARDRRAASSSSTRSCRCSTTTACASAPSWR